MDEPRVSGDAWNEREKAGLYVSHPKRQFRVLSTLRKRLTHAASLGAVRATPAVREARERSVWRAAEAAAGLAQRASALGVFLAASILKLSKLSDESEDEEQRKRRGQLTPRPPRSGGSLDSLV